jgi:hypothetical protein
MKETARIAAGDPGGFSVWPFVNFYLDRASAGQVRCKVIRVTLCLYGGNYEHFDACQVSDQWL